ncbi:MAG: TolC family protein [Nitrospiraceae bacterium]
MSPDSTSAPRQLWLTVCALLLTAGPAFGQEVLLKGKFLALRQAVELGLKQHPAVLEAQAQVNAADARIKQTQSLYYPQVYADANTVAGAGRNNPRFMISGGLLQENQSTFAGGLLANQRIYDFGFTQNMVESSKLAAEAQGQDLRARRSLITLTVQRAYFNSLKRQRLVQVAEETVRERGTITGQIAALHRQQLKSKLDLNLAQVELTNAESQLVRARNDLKASFVELNRAMGIQGLDDYVLEDLPVAIHELPPLPSLLEGSQAHPELRRAKEFTASAEAKLVATKRQYLPTISAFASGGAFEPFDTRQGQQTGGWWTAGALVSMPLFTGFLIENQVREAGAQQAAAQAASANIEQALSQQVTTSYLETLTIAQQIRLAEEQVRTAKEALQLSQQRYKLGLGTVVEVTQAQVAVATAKTRLAESQYDYVISQATLAYAAGLITADRPDEVLR